MSYMIEKYLEYFGSDNVFVFTTPGRTELGGNHTDHQNGQVVAAAVDLHIKAATSPINDTVAGIYSEGYGYMELDISDLSIHEDEKGKTVSLVRGGFAGTIQAFVKNEVVGRYREAMDKLFGEGACKVLKIGTVNRG